MLPEKISENVGMVKEAQAGAWFGFGLAALFLLYKYCRIVLLPCLTLAELECALESLRINYRNTTENRVGPGELVEEAWQITCFEWNDIAVEYLNLKVAASKIRERHLDESSKWWKYTGIDPGLMPAIARWYAEAEELKRRILKAQEKDRQDRFEVELSYRRRHATTPYTAGSSYASAYESPFRNQTLHVVNNSIEVVNSRQAPNNAATRARRTWHLNDGAASNVTM
ncbi:hypothetical protein V5O48_013768 [Marasmius crinis-equi]|uniref:Uncharacterized protein n=1 Tax=Marasmius crinis-equi TaxID=585013 RepID=A0ABR3EZ68_9AGAR